MSAMPKTSLAKKILAAIALVLSLALLASPFIPFYRVNLGEAQSVFANVITYLNYTQTPKAIAFVIIVSLSASVSAVAAVMYARCLLAKPLYEDKEDKFFVFGSAFFALSGGLYGAICFSANAYAPMFFGLGVAVIGVILLVLHFKVLSDI